MGEGDVFDFVLSRFRISLLLSIKNDAKYLPKVSQRRPYMYIRRRLHGHTSKKVHDALEEKKNNSTMHCHITPTC